MLALSPVTCCHALAPTTPIGTTRGGRCPPDAAEVLSPALPYGGSTIRTIFQGAHRGTAVLSLTQRFVGWKANRLLAQVRSALVANHRASSSNGTGITGPPCPSSGAAQRMARGALLSFTVLRPPLAAASTGFEPHLRPRAFLRPHPDAISDLPTKDPESAAATAPTPPTTGRPRPSSPTCPRARSSLDCRAVAANVAALRVRPADYRADRTRPTWRSRMPAAQAAGCGSSFGAGCARSARKCSRASRR